jgi:L-asparaginase II
MASSHSGEDFHVRTLQGMFRRAGVSQTLLACGSEGMPLDALTAARLARDGEKPGPIRHMCSGQHAVSLLLSG